MYYYFKIKSSGCKVHFFIYIFVAQKRYFVAGCQILLAKKTVTVIMDPYNRSTGKNDVKEDGQKMITERERVRETFENLFGSEGEIRLYFAPGRVNMIGEHTDYNGGHVFPCALTIGTYAAARKRTDRKLRLYR